MGLFPDWHSMINRQQKSIIKHKNKFGNRNFIPALNLTLISFCKTDFGMSNQHLMQNNIFNLISLFEKSLKVTWIRKIISNTNVPWLNLLLDTVGNLSRIKSLGLVWWPKNFEEV